MTNSFADFPKAKLILAIGTNMTEAHPVASTFVKNAVANGAELYVVDPRKTALAKLSKQHFPIRVGSDIAFINGLMHVLITEDLYDREYVQRCCEGFDELKAKVLEYPPERVGEISGIPAESIRQLARRLAAIKPGMLCYTLGITEHTCGVNNVLSTANLQMLLGNVGFECGGVNPLRGQNNVQGACDMGALPNVYPGYHKVDTEASQELFRKVWSVDKLSKKPGLMMPDMLDGLATGAMKAFYVFGENLANTEPDIRHMEHCLASAEFLVCQDIFPTETTRFAHVIFPAAAWSEKDGTFTNSERRVNRVRAVSKTPGLAKQDWLIFKELAKRWGHNWESNSAQELWDNEISVVAPQLKGIKYARIENDGLQWPCPTLEHPGTPTLHRDGHFTSGRGRLMPVDWTPPAEVADAEYPFVLSSGRRLYHYHTRTQTGRAKGLNTLMGEETADISPADAEALGIENGEVIRVSSRRGKVLIKAKVTDEVPKGLVWMSFHFRETNANWLTNPAFDPISKTAEYKACAVAVEKLRYDAAKTAFPEGGPSERYRMNFESIEKVLEFAIDKEKEAVAFYNELSKKESIADLVTTFRELAQEEANHVKLLTSISKKKTVIESYEVHKVTNLKISDYLVEVEYSEGMPMQDILVLAMKREEKALKLYTNLAACSLNDDFTKLFTFLAQEEAKHKLTFERLYDDYQAGRGN